MKTRNGKVPIDIGQCDGEGLIELSVSRAKKWKSCQLAHDYRYVQKLRPKRKVRPLTLGSLCHSCLEARALGKNWVQEIKSFKEGDWAKLFEEERLELGDIPGDAYRIMRGYHYYYLESDKRYETIAAEVPFRVRIEGTPIVLTGVIDLVVLDTTDNSIWCFEHKTVKKDLPTEEFKMTDFQTTIYLYAMEVLSDKLGYSKSQIKGVILDYLKTAPPTIPEILKNGTLSKRKIKCDRHTYLECIKKIGGDPADYEEILEYMDTNVFYKRVPLTKSQSLLQMTLTDFINCGKQIRAISGKAPVRNLAWTCDRPRCEYRDLCIADIQGLDTTMLIKLNFESQEEDENGESEDEAGDIE